MMQMIKFVIMKKLLLAIILLVFTLTGFSQSLSSGTTGWSSQLQEEVISSELRIYPNPCRENKVTIEFSVKQITEIRLINITGKEVYQKSYPIPENKKQVELTGIPNGIYIIRIKTDDQNLVTKKLMISKN